MIPAKSHRSCGAGPGQLAAALFVAVLVAPTAVAQQASADDADRLLAFAQCIRENGYAEYPDPGPDGRLEVRLADESSAERLQAARDACRDVAPPGVAYGPPSLERMERLLVFAQCMRGNGLSEFPDPDAEGHFSLVQADVDPSPTMQLVMESCVAAGGGLGVIGGIRIKP